MTEFATNFENVRRSYFLFNFFNLFIKSLQTFAFSVHRIWNVALIFFETCSSRSQNKRIVFKIRFRSFVIRRFFTRLFLMNSFAKRERSVIVSGMTIVLMKLIDAMFGLNCPTNSDETRFVIKNMFESMIEMFSEKMLTYSKKRICPEINKKNKNCKNRFDCDDRNIVMGRGPLGGGKGLAED